MCERRHNYLLARRDLDLQASIGNQPRNISLGFTEPTCSTADPKLALRVFSSRYNYNQARITSWQTGQKVNLTQDSSRTSQITQASTGFQLSVEPRLHQSFKRIGNQLPAGTPRRNLQQQPPLAVSPNLAYSGNYRAAQRAGRHLTSQITPSFSFSTIDSTTSPAPRKEAFRLRRRLRGVAETCVCSSGISL